MSNQRRCDKCEWWERVNDSVMGLCRIHTPHHPLTTQDLWPTTHPADWCSHFTAKRVKLDEPSEQEKEEIMRDLREHEERAAKPPEPAEPALKPCPFCGGRAYRLIWPRFTAVTCEQCKAITPNAATVAEAVAAWNRRTP